MSERRKVFHSPLFVKEGNMVLELRPEQIRALRAQQRVNIEVDRETYQLMRELAASAGSDIATLLRKLGAKYQKSNFLEKQLVVSFLNKV